MPYPWRTPRCAYCHNMAVGKDEDNEDVCVYHMPKENFKIKADNACYDLIDLVGRDEYIHLIDLRFPGPDNMKIPEKERLEWAVEECERIKRLQTPIEGHNRVTWEQAEKLRQQYYCSDCWDELHAEFISEDLYLVRCSTPNCTTPGFVSGSSIKFKLRVADEHLYLAKKAVKAALPWMRGFDSKRAERKMFDLLGMRGELR